MKEVFRYAGMILRQATLLSISIVDVLIFIAGLLGIIPVLDWYWYLIIFLLGVVAAVFSERKSAPGPLGPAGEIRCRARDGHEYDFGLAGPKDETLPDAFVDLNLRIENTGSVSLGVIDLSVDITEISSEKLPWWFSDARTIHDDQSKEISLAAPHKLEATGVLLWKVRLPLPIELNLEAAKFASELGTRSGEDSAVRVRVTVEATASDGGAQQPVFAGTTIKLTTTSLQDLYVDRWQTLGSRDLLDLARRPKPGAGES